MAEEKQSNRVFVSFILTAEELDPAEVSAKLGLIPFKSFRRGDSRKDSSRWKHGYWELCSVVGIDSPDLTSHLEWIVNQITPVNQMLQELLSSQNMKAKISCFWILESGQTVLTLSPLLLVRLSEMRVGIELDIYSDR